MNKIADMYLDPPPAADQQIGGMQVEQSPYFTPPHDAQSFFAAGLAAIPVSNGVANRVELTNVAGQSSGLPYLIPPGYEAIIKKLGIMAQGNGSLDFSGAWIVQMFIDTVPVQNFEAVAYQIGTIAAPVDVFIKVKAGQTIHFYTYSQTIPGTGNALAVISGYQWAISRQQSYLTRRLQ
jgi:hypothetical protein